MTALTSRLPPLILCWSLSRFYLTLFSTASLFKLTNVFIRKLIVILLLRAAVHPHPGPTPPPPPPPKTFLQWNCNGIRGKQEKLSSYLDANNVKVACLQETKLTPRAKDPSIPGYTIIRRDRPSGGVGGGVAILVHNSVTFTPLNVNINAAIDDKTEAQGINVIINNSPISVINVYCPPTSACPRGFLPDAVSILDGDFGDCLILGDWNAHHEAWHSSHSDVRGDHLAAEVEISDFCVLNEDKPTRLPQGANNNQRPSSPDVSLISAHLALAVNWSTETTLTSDHLPIAISFNDDSPCPRTTKTYVNFSRADWDGFNTELESLVRDLPRPSTCGKGEKLIRQAIQTASKHHIPAGYRKDFSPTKNREAESLEERYDDLRQQNPQDPSLEDLGQEIKRIRNESARDKWRTFIDSLDRRSNPKRFWNVLKGLSGSKKHVPPNQPIRFNGKFYTKPTSISNRFNFQYTNLKTHKSSKKSRTVKRNLKSSHPLDPNFKPFTPVDVAAAIKRAKNSTAVGPDGISILHLKHMGPLALDYFTSLFNISVSSADIPSIWKSALVLPVLKPGKDPIEGPSYRPISLLCPASKVLERLILPYLSVLELSESQHGFRPQRSPTSALLPLATSVIRGFNERKPPMRTVAAAIDLSRAFDMVNHDILLEKLSDSPLNSNIVRWLSAYLRGRHQAVIYNGIKSRFKQNRRGVPQGAVLSPTLFNYYVADLPPVDSEVTTFADDITLYDTSVEIEE